jgi:Uri superfamily endonuclease
VPTSASGPADGGLYLLLVHVVAAVDARIGRLGTFALCPGLYIYVGSACRGLTKRVARHERRKKPLRWHIDYLTTLPQASVVASVLIRPVQKQLGADPQAQPDGRRATDPECRLNQWVGRVLEAGVPIPGFGASDCRAGCPAHLWFVPGS